MPPGVDAMEAWEVVAKLRREMATVLDYPPWFPYVEGGSIWFSTPKKSQNMLLDISAVTAEGASLSRSITKMDGYHFCQYLMLDEFIAACASDGVEIDPERARRAAFHRDEPQSDGERLFVNLCNTFAYAGVTYKGRDITYGLIEDIGRDMAKGIGSDIGHVGMFELANPEVFTPDYVLGLICRLAAGKGASDPLHPVIASGEMSRMFWDLRPLERFNACVELVVRKIFYANTGQPACAFVHATRVERAWRERGGAEGGVFLASGYPAEYMLDGVDGTLYHDMTLRHMVRELDILDNKVRSFANKRKRQKRKLDEEGGFNEREKDVILNLLRNPTVKVTIGRHRERHGIAYSTAHDDLAHLEAEGILRAGKEGRAIVYHAGSGLQELV